MKSFEKAQRRSNLDKPAVVRASGFPSLPVGGGGGAGVRALHTGLFWQPCPMGEEAPGQSRSPGGEKSQTAEGRVGRAVGGEGWTEEASSLKKSGNNTESTVTAGQVLS